MFSRTNRSVLREFLPTAGQMTFMPISVSKGSLDLRKTSAFALGIGEKSRLDAESSGCGAEIA